MIKDFDTVKQQLKELSEVVNSFKSEAVQLKIVELLLNGREKKREDEEPQESEILGENPPAKQQRKKATRQKPIVKEGDAKKQAPRSKLGPSSILNQFLEEGFFKTKRTINDVINHGRSSMATNLPITSLSGPLGKLVRDKILKREKNEETDQYEYFNN